MSVNYVFVLSRLVSMMGITIAAAAAVVLLRFLLPEHLLAVMLLMTESLRLAFAPVTMPNT